jgi:hypothetical protein
MGRHAFRIAAVTAAIVLLSVVPSAIRASGQQSSAARSADAKKSVTYFIAAGNRETGYRSSDRELVLWALEAWQRSTAKGFQIKPANESSALIRLYWAEPDAGEYGETRPLIVGGQRGAAVYIRPDIDSLGPDIARRASIDPLLRESIVYLTCLHELGHALGLEHTRDFRDIMYYFGYGGDVVQYFGRYRAQIHSRSDIAVVSGLSDGDVGRIKALYPPE